MTYWLLHDVCADLAKQDMEKHTFSDDNIHRQIVDFAKGGKVIANRGKTDWEINGQILPSYGFIAESGQYKAMVTKRDGVISAYTESPDSVFVDARPPEEFKPAQPDERLDRINASRKIVNFGNIETNGAFRLLKDKKMVIPLPESQSFEVVLNLSALNLPAKVSRVEAINENLEKQEDVEFVIVDGRLRFTTKLGFFAYRLVE